MPRKSARSHQLPMPGKLYAPTGPAYAAAVLRGMLADPRCAAHAAGMIASLIGCFFAMVGLIVVFGPELAR